MTMSATAAVCATVLCALCTANALQIPFSSTNAASHGSVVRCTPLVPTDFNAANAANVFQLADELGVDLWTENPHIERSIDFRVQDQQQVEQVERALSVACTPWIDASTLTALASRGTSHFSAAASTEEDPLAFFKDYRPFDDLVARVRSLAEKYSHLARFNESIGVSHEGRHMPVIHITAPAPLQTSVATKKVVWINGGIHAREWISSHTAVFLVQSLLTGYESDPAVKDLLTRVEFVIAPHINPDGYEYARLHNRMWRKNRRVNSDGSRGVDLNRNYNVKWGRGGSSSSPWSDTYMGPYAGSEPETQAVSNYVPPLNASIGIDLHSYGQLLMRPWGNSLDDHPREAVNKKLGDGMRDVIAAFSGARYTSQKSAGLYPVTGGLDDWLTSTGMIGFTFELRDRGNYGFVLPKEQIIPTGKEIFEAIKYLGKFVGEEM